MLFSRFAAVNRAFFADDEGATAIEYGLIAALLSVGILVAVQSVGTETANTFGKVETAVTAAIAGP